ncbi:monosaccharide ABC transporter ATP-binding protein (CUT2 family) [Mobilisporobacter senegalensis]|uniref:Monosaccharide ABC transporter ATP-binding protein (CUT2 family) n=1 Tax=Mobilisporobacter senegalensis TaxID=1329262 RepID=A0A3N1XPQ2_9FIRM|nr:ATP-binding cassette domain-containing protein [Mobilisporobacter senegalensis]ROR28660.1 monosaccharide ABC transporter ATP-binding protein (CUT2 family) [Mobilisporobacter senegalensis]
MREEILRMENVTCKYDGITFLDHINLNIFKGEIMGLIPINSQGKSWLFNLLCQNYPIDYGRIYINNQLVNYYEHSAYNRNRVYIIEKKSKLIQDLSVSDNIFVLKRGFRKYIINRKVLNKQVNLFLEEMNVSIDPDELVMNLNSYEQCIVELLKAIISGSKLIVISDISNILSVVDLSKLLDLIKSYSEKGFTFLYVGNHHEEVFKICDRVALMKDGRIIRVLDEKELTEDNIKAYTISFEDAKPSAPKYDGQGILKFENVSTNHLKNMSFTIEKGECVVFFDTNNMIYSDLLQIMNGEMMPGQGEIIWNQKRFTSKLAKNALENGIAVIVENATVNMLFQNLSYVENLYFLIERKLKSVKNKSKVLKSIITEYENIVGQEIYETDISKLGLTSLYNLVYYRIHLYKPKVVFCLQPFSGADMYLRKHIADLIRELKRKGIAVIILAVSISDTLTIADRFLVIENGSIVKEFSKEKFSSLRSIV